MKRTLIPLILLLLNTGFCALVSGEVYTDELDLAMNVLVSVNTVPAQFMISKDGAYSFNIPPGNYTITANYFNESGLFAEENVSIIDDGDYVIDLILLPDLDFELEQLIDSNVSFTEVEEIEPVFNILYIFIILLIVSVTIILLYFKFRNGEWVDDELEQTLLIIKNNGGRVSQKDLRKELGLSEAKVSLIVTDLVDRGFVKKIKKGRANVLVLIKK